MRLQSDLSALCIAAIEGNLADQSPQWDSRAAIGVVLAAGGYPFDYEKGSVISGISNAEDSAVKVFQAGTKLENETLVTSGGRVLCVTALGDTVAAAQQQAYEGVKKINWDNVYFRTDIGHKAINR